MSTQAAALISTPVKMAYIDHLKIILTILVILHHTFITYGAPGSWYYMQKTTQQAALIPMTLFVAVNQSFFMGFFFFLSAYFIPASYQKKGAARFVKDRLIRLGIPLVFYSLVLSPVLNYTVEHYGYGRDHSFIEYMSGYHHWVDFGVLWFVAALLLFTLLYVIFRLFVELGDQTLTRSLSSGELIVFAVALGLISFMVRLIFPIGWVLPPLGFQLGHFTQYIGLFIAGICASKYDWLAGVTYKQGKRAALVAIVLVLTIFPLFYVLLSTLKFPSDYFSGGFHWQALLYAMWEQSVGIAIITALIGMGKRLFIRPTAFSGKLSRYTYAAYIFHPLVVISTALMLSNWRIEPAFKLLAAAPLTVMLSFLLASLIVAIPVIRKIV